MRPSSAAEAEDALALVGSAARLSKKRPKGKNPHLDWHGPRPSDSWPAGNPRAIGMQEHMGETALAQALATKFAATLRDAESIAALQEAAVTLEGQLKRHQFTHRALVVAVNRRACELLAKSWPGPDEAMEDLYRMHDLRQQNLMAPWRAVKEAITRALVLLCSGAHWRSSSSQLHGPGESPQQALHVWIQQTYVFAQFAEAGFLPPEEAREVEQQLDLELNQILHRIPAPDLYRFGAYLRAGGGYILRARAAWESGIHMMPPATIKPVAKKGELPPEVPTSVSNAAFEALRAAERAGGADEKAAPRAAAQLQQLGLDDPLSPISPAGRRASRSASEGTLLPRSPAKPGDTLSHHDLLRRASALRGVRGHLGPDALPVASHVRGEVVAGIGAVGHVGTGSGASWKGLAPVGGGGMSALQRALLQVHAAKPMAAKPERATRPALPLVACGRAPPVAERATH